MKAWALKQGKYHYTINTQLTRRRLGDWREVEGYSGKIVRVRITEIKPCKRKGK